MRKVGRVSTCGTRCHSCYKPGDVTNEESRKGKHMWHPLCHACYKPGDVTNEESRKGKHMWHPKVLDCDYNRQNICMVICNRYSVIVMVISYDFNLTIRNPWFRSFLVSSNPLLRK
jgi:hypothetical protein